MIGTFLFTAAENHDIVLLDGAGAGVVVLMTSTDWATSTSSSMMMTYSNGITTNSAFRH